MTLVHTRKKLIKQTLDRDGEIKIHALSDALGVSAETIRRDLISMESNGELRRIRGGATASMDIPRLEDRSAVKSEEKMRIGYRAAQLVESGQTVFLGAGGSGAVAIAQALARRSSCHLVTASIAVARTLGASNRHEVHLTGGCYDAHHDALRGAAVFESLEDRFFDIGFFSAHAIDPANGVLDGAEFQFRLQRLLVERSRRYVVCADHSKIGRPSAFATLPLTAIDTFVTDCNPEEDLMTSLKKSNVEVIVAEQPASEAVRAAT